MGRDAVVLSPADRNTQKLLTLLGERDMTIAALLTQGVRSPAQSVYDLQLAGYVIERARINVAGETGSVQYRLRTPTRTVRD